MADLRRLSLLLSLLLLGICCWGSLGRYSRYGIDPSWTIGSSAIRPDQGHAFVAPTHELPGFFTVMADDAAHPFQGRTALEEDGRAIGPPHATEDAIRQYGRGRFTQWKNILRFSASDNSDPRTNGHRYRIHILLVPTGLAYLAAWSLFALAVGWNGRCLATGARRCLALVFRVPGGRWIWLNVIPGIAISLALLGAIFAGGELWLRSRSNEPFSEVKWPGAWSPEATFTFAPNSEIWYTNHLDYWLKQKTNSFGFADRDWNPDKPPGALRVEFIGDSFVEALQVPIEQKSHVIFERMANKAFPGRKIETAAFGMSGTGQSNQLPFYDTAGRRFQPDVVVLVVVSNDFGNNSAILEGVRNGWHPEHLPRLFFVRPGPGEPFHAAPLDPKWEKYLLNDGTTGSGSLVARIHAELMNRLLFYSWLVEATNLHFPKIAALLPGNSTQQQIYSGRMAALRKLPHYEHSLDGWNYPQDWDFDLMFGAKRLPPVFAEAVAATGKSLDEFQARARRDGFRLVIFMSNDMSHTYHDAAIEKATGNPGLVRGQFVRFKQLADTRGIPVVDMEDYLERHHIPSESIHWAHDSHWNNLGHQMAAAALLEAFSAHQEWLEPSQARIGNK